MTEKNIEQKFVKEVKGLGGICPKFISPGLNGMPDRLVLLPMGHFVFVELKCTGGKLRTIQIKRKPECKKEIYKI